MKIQKEEYKLNELADAWGLSVDDLLDLAKRGELEVCVWADGWTVTGQGAGRIYYGPHPISPLEVARLRHPSGRPVIDGFVDIYASEDGEEVYLEHIDINSQECSTESLFVTREERERFEDKQLGTPGREEQKAHTEDLKKRLQRDFEEAWWRRIDEGKGATKEAVCNELFKRPEYKDTGWKFGTFMKNTKRPRRRKAS